MGCNCTCDGYSMRQYISYNHREVINCESGAWWHTICKVSKSTLLSLAVSAIVKYSSSKCHHQKQFPGLAPVIMQQRSSHRGKKDGALSVAHPVNVIIIHDVDKEPFERATVLRDVEETREIPRLSPRDTLQVIIGLDDHGVACAIDLPLIRSGW